MRGSIRKRGPNTWQIVVDAGKQANGLRRQTWRTIHGPKKAAQSSLASLIREIETGTVADAGRITIADYIETWLSSIKSRVVTSTWERYGLALRPHVVPSLGALRLIDLRPMHLQKLYADLLERGRRDGKGGLSARSVHHVHVVFGGALREAVRLQLLARDPASAVKPPRVNRKEMLALDEIQAATLLNRSKQTRLYVPILLALSCGLRRGEILGLRWGDIDLKARRLSVCRELVRAEGKLVFKGPKSKKGIRSVALPRMAVDFLLAHRVTLAAEEIALRGVRDQHDLICPGLEGSPWHPAGFSDAFARFVGRQVDLPRVRFHDLRHTHATLLLRANVPAKVVSERLGHASTGITLDVYSHVLPGMQEDAAVKVDLAFGYPPVEKLPTKSPSEKSVAFSRKLLARRGQEARG